MAKQYDQAYFDKWYRGSRRISSDNATRRKASAAVVLAEYFLRRSIRSVLDIGCGEGVWFTHLNELRPKITYLGLDPSDYAVDHFGKSRRVRKGSFGDLDKLSLGRRYDLIVCADVLHYLEEKEIRRGVTQVAKLAGGVAFLEVLTKEDDVVGDLDGFHRRSAAWYRTIFARAGLIPVGPYSWISRFHAAVSELELAR